MSLPKTQFIETVLRSPVVQIPSRSVVFELETARILYSPGTALTEAQLLALGRITDLVAPNLQHTAGMPRAAAAHPEARLWGPAGVREKHPTLHWHGILGVDPWPYGDELEPVPLAGMPRMNEVAFVHRASNALYVADLVFNVTEPRGLLTGTFFRVFGAYRRLAVNGLFLKFVKDRPAFEASIASLAGHDFAHVVPCHGEPALDDGRERFAAALRERRLLA